MMRMTTQQQKTRINDALYELHKDISLPISAGQLATVAAYSEHHFHRVFQRVVGETVNTYIRRTRLEHAANQLMFDQQSTVQEIAEKCGFQSLSSFSKAFKSTFSVTPGAWRGRTSKSAERHYLSDPVFAQGQQRVSQRPLPKPKIKVFEPQFVAYVRHLGYDWSIQQAWQVLASWARTQDVFDGAKQIGLHHSNPALVPLEKCRYVACLSIDQSIPRRGKVSTLTIPGGEYAVLDVVGEYGDLVPVIDQLLHQWLPLSGFKMGTTPILATYKKNHFLIGKPEFELELAIPVSAI